MNITRDDYLRMVDRHLPFWASLDEFVLVNGIQSVVEVGCGLGHLCYRVDSYTGIDLNQKVLTDNELFYRRGTWLCEDWLAMNGLVGELFLASAVIEHCKSFQVVLEKALRLPYKYIVVTFSKGLRDKSASYLQKTDHRFFENYYSRAEVEAWLSSKLDDGRWYIYDFPLSRRKRQAMRESVLVIDRTGTAKLDMWEKRNVTS